MRKILCAVYVMGCVLMSSALGKITYIDATPDNATLNGAALVLGTTYSSDYSNVTDNLWGYRSRNDVDGGYVWVTDGGAVVGDSESTEPLKIDITLPSAGVSYDLYVVIMNNNSGSGFWDVAARIGDTGDFINYNKNSEEMTQALASDFEGTVTVSSPTAGDRSYKVMIGQYTPAAANEIVSIYINGLDSWQDGASHDQRTRFDGVGYEATPPTVISPFDGETGVETPTVLLEWTGGQDPNAVGHYVYLSTDPEALECLNPASMLSVTAGEYSYSPIEENAIYYWQIEVAMDTGSGVAGDPNNIFGPVWSFAAVLSKPVINSSPSSQVVEAGGTAVFTVDVESLSTPTYAWYSSVDPNNNTPADDVLQTNDASLIISPAAIADEGYYYCVVNNDSGVAVASDVANLAVARLMAHWTFDDYDSVNNQYLDVSGEGRHADPNGVPTFVTGQVNDGISIPSLNGAAPSAESWARAGTWSASELSGMLTVSFWVYWYGPEGSSYVTQNLVCKGGENGIDWRILSNGNGNLVLSSDRGNYTASGTFLEVNTWVYCTVAFNGSTAYFYKNGELISSGGFQLGGFEDGMLCLGGKYFDTTPQGWMNGALDEVRIYNYGLSDLEVAQLFIADEPNGSVCVESLKPNARYDLNGDCIVNLTDFAELAGSWLDCGLIPDCTQ